MAGRGDPVPAKSRRGEAMGARGFLGKRKRGLERTCRGAALGLGGPKVVTRREQAVRGGALPWRRRSG